MFNINCLEQTLNVLKACYRLIVLKVPINANQFTWNDDVWRGVPRMFKLVVSQLCILLADFASLSIWKYSLDIRCVLKVHYNLISILLYLIHASMRLFHSYTWDTALQSIIQSFTAIYWYKQLCTTIHIISYYAYKRNRKFLAKRKNFAFNCSRINSNTDG